MESFGANQSSSEKEQRIKELDEQIAAKKEEWRQLEERNYVARMNAVSPVDQVKLQEGNREEGMKEGARHDIEQTTRYQMDNLKREIEDLEKERYSI